MFDEITNRYSREVIAKGVIDQQQLGKTDSALDEVRT